MCFYIFFNYLIIYILFLYGPISNSLTHEEAEIILNDFYSGACGGHLFGEPLYICVSL